ncbi:hypothetical protein INS49_006162 [Diaporthe citri]|uniref:uncharacterized protein n=1 Tax=Diaporthe citri TaxID=83186 RepID=UPI001C81D444|nr:uncharacterized protein INS49_006162 [Diaporthe citri]KAG6364560.1 hypothetical protein INS49_006162 [Diaporthe citri]
MIEDEDDREGRVMQDARVPRNVDFMNDGFLFVEAIRMGTSTKYDMRGNRLKEDKSIFVVQSASTGELFVNKIIERPWDPVGSLSSPPSELRVSTYRHAIGDARIDLPGDNDDDVHRRGVLPNVPYFNKLRFWQELDPRDSTSDCTVYSLFFDYCNGGAVDELVTKYNKRLIAVPEHFIWLVAEQMFLALVAMKFGRHTVQRDEDEGSRHGSEPAEDSTQQPDNWVRIYHRDLHANNVFINYPPRGPGRIPRAGLESNAFPEIVVGDFGNSGIEGDDPATLPVCVYQPWGEEDTEGFLAEWEDIYSVGEMLRTMSMAHIHHDRLNTNDRPNCGRVQVANQEPGAPPYSDELIELLQRFEFPNHEHDLVRDLGEAIDTTFPSPEDVRDTLLPQAQARVAGFRRPADRPAGYYDSIDVSWTKPEKLMPFSYIMKYAAEAGDGPNGEPLPEEEGDDHDSDHGDAGSGDGSGDESGDGPSIRGGEGEDVEMSDSPSSSGQDGHDQPDDGPQQPEDIGHRGGASDDNHDEDEEDEDEDDDADDSGSMAPSPPPTPTSEQLAMRELGKMHKWNKAKPRYELRSLEYAVPVILPLKTPP